MSYTVVEHPDVAAANRVNEMFRNCRVRVKQSKSLGVTRKWTNPFLIGLNGEQIEFRPWYWDIPVTNAPGTVTSRPDFNGFGRIDGAATTRAA